MKRIDPVGKVLYDSEGKAYLKITRAEEEKPVPVLSPEEHIEHAENLLQKVAKALKPKKK